MNMRDLCLMNADKTDISNTTGPGIKRPVLYFQGKNQLESQSARDPHAVKQGSAGTAGEAEARESAKQPRQGTESHNRQNCHQDQSVGDQENPEDICRGSQHQLRNKKFCNSKQLRGTTH